MSFPGFYPFSNWERESGKQNLGVKEKCPKVTYLIFLTGSHWRIFLFSLANRLCSVFSTGLEDFGVLHVSVSLLSLARSKMAIVRLPRDLLKNYLFLYLLPLRGREPHFRLGSPPIIWLHFLFPLPMSGDPRSLRCEHLRDPHSLLTVTFWLLDNVSSTGGGISFPPPRLREPSRDNKDSKTTLKRTKRNGVGSGIHRLKNQIRCHCIRHFDTA